VLSMTLENSMYDAFWSSHSLSNTSQKQRVQALKRDVGIGLFFRRLFCDASLSRLSFVVLLLVRSRIEHVQKRHRGGRSRRDSLTCRELGRTHVRVVTQNHPRARRHGFRRAEFQQIDEREGDVDSRRGERVLPRAPRAVFLLQKRIVRLAPVFREPHQVLQAQQASAPEIRRGVHALPPHGFPPLVLQALRSVGIARKRILAVGEGQRPQLAQLPGVVDVCRVVRDVHAPREPRQAQLLRLRERRGRALAQAERGEQPEEKFVERAEQIEGGGTRRRPRPRTVRGGRPRYPRPPTAEAGSGSRHRRPRACAAASRRAKY
jgi:hypothetical protein